MRVLQQVQKASSSHLYGKSVNAKNIFIKNIGKDNKINLMTKVVVNIMYIVKSISFFLKKKKQIRNPRMSVYG